VEVIEATDAAIDTNRTVGMARQQEVAETAARPGRNPIALSLVLLRAFLNLREALRLAARSDATRKPTRS